MQRRLGYLLLASGVRRVLTVQRLLQCLTRPSEKRAIQLEKVRKQAQFLVFEAVESGPRRYVTSVKKAYFHRDYPDHVSHVETLAQGLELRLVHAGRQLLFLLEERIQAEITSLTALYALGDGGELVLVGTYRAVVSKARPAESRSAGESILLAPLRSISALRLCLPQTSEEETSTLSFDVPSMNDASVQAAPYAAKSLASASFLTRPLPPKRLNPLLRSISHCKSRSQPVSLERLALKLRSPLRVRK